MNAKTVFKVVLKTLLPLLVLAVAGVGFVKLVQSRQPPLKRERPHLGPLVRVAPARSQEVAVTVTAFGNVRPRKQLDITPQVSGLVLEVSPNLIDGGFVKEGELLLRIDPRDYQLAVDKARAEGARAVYELTRAEEEAEVARQEWEMLRDNPPPAFLEQPPAEDSLLFHGPQLNLAQANVDAARARLAEAELALTRTEVRSPYAARVREESVALGQFVSAGRSLATLYSIDVVEIVLPVPDTDLAWIGGEAILTGGNGPAVTVSVERGGERQQWPGRVVRTDGVIDPKTRMVHLIVEVHEPFRKGRAPLTVGMFVQGEVQGRRLRGVVPLPRHTLREGDTVWVVDGESRLRIREAAVARVTDATVYLSRGVADGERVILSRLDAVTDGMAVRVVEGE